MQNKIYNLLILTILLFLGKFAIGQNLELIGKKGEKPKINGGLSINTTGYLSTDTLARRDPFNYYLTGNLTTSLYGWTVPFTFSYSNQNSQFTHPFNQFSLHPYYKWIKLHAGFTSMSFSPYSLNGHLFLGGGVELAPKKVPITFSAMYGRLRKAVESDTTKLTPTPSVFERWGYGFNVAYDYKTSDYVNAKVSFNLFRAEDRPGSLTFLPDTALSPGENVVLGTTIDAMVISRIKITSELATSAVTENINSEFTGNSGNSWHDNFGGLIKSNGTTEYFKAYKANATWLGDIYSIGMGYERIDPGYNSYGAYYFNNDFENVTVNATLSLLEKKVNLATNVGKQRDNLDNSKASDMDRWVMAFNADYSSGKKLSAGFSYSQFTSFTHIRPQLETLTQLTEYDNLDTLNYTQLSTSTSVNINYILKNDKKTRQNINANVSYQRSSEKQNNDLVAPGSEFYNINSSYSYGIIPISLTAVLSLNTSINLMPDMTTSTFGPTLSVNKLMFNKKLRNSLALSYNKVVSSSTPKNGVFSARFSSSIRIKKRHNFSLGLTFMNRKKQVEEKQNSINEFIANFGYSFSF